MQSEFVATQAVASNSDFSPLFERTASRAEQEAPAKKKERERDGLVTDDCGNLRQLHTERASVPKEDLQRAVLKIPSQTDVRAPFAVYAAVLPSGLEFRTTESSNLCPQSSDGVSGPWRVPPPLPHRWLWCFSTRDSSPKPPVAL